MLVEYALAPGLSQVLMRFRSDLWKFVMNVTVSTPAHREINGGDHAVGASDAFPGNFKCCAVIGTGARKWEAQRDVHTFVKGMQLQWDQSLIVIHAKHRVEVALNRAMENCVGGVGTSKDCRLRSEAGLAVFADIG